MNIELISRPTIGERDAGIDTERAYPREAQTHTIAGRCLDIGCFECFASHPTDPGIDKDQPGEFRRDVCSRTYEREAELFAADHESIASPGR